MPRSRFMGCGCDPELPCSLAAKGKNVVMNDRELFQHKLEIESGTLMAENRRLKEELSEWKSSWWLLDENEARLLSTIADLRRQADVHVSVGWSEGDSGEKVDLMPVR